METVALGKTANLVETEVPVITEAPEATKETIKKEKTVTFQKTTSKNKKLTAVVIGEWVSEIKKAAKRAAFFAV